MHVSRITSVCAVLLSISAAVAAQPGKPSPPTVTQPRQQAVPAKASPVSDPLSDPGLAVAITFQSPVIYVGELLEELQRQSGIAIEIDGADTASGERIAVSLTNLPLRDAMKALCSLLSYRDAPWYWTKEDGKTPKPRYVLHCSSAARNLPARLRAMALRQLETDVTENANAARMSDDELKDAVKDHRAPEWINALDGPWMVEGWRLFNSVIPATTRTSLLQQSSSPRFAVSDVPPAGKKFLDPSQRPAFLPRDVALDSNAAPLENRPTHVSFQTVWDDRSPSPTLYVQLESITGVGGISSESLPMGGGIYTHEKTADKLLKEWLGKGDSETSEQEKKSLPSLNPPADSTNDNSLARFRRLNLIAKAQSLSFLARLPTDKPLPVFSASADKTLRGFLGPSSGVHRRPDGLFEVSPLGMFWQHKWHGDILLLQFASWFTPPNYREPVSWKQVRELRQAEEDDPHGFLPAARYLPLIPLLKPEQLQTLGEEFTLFTQLTPGWLALCQQFRRYPHLRERLFAEGGVPIASLPEALALLKEHGSIPDETKLARARVRLYEEEEKGSTGPDRMRSLFLRLDAEDGSTLAATSLNYLNYQSRRYRRVPLPENKQ